MTILAEIDRIYYALGMSGPMVQPVKLAAADCERVLEMPISDVEIRDFSVFSNLRLQFSPGLNVFIGQNSTGKSHLMKLLYSLIKPLEQAGFNTPDEPVLLKARLQEKLIRVFKPDEGQLGRLVRRKIGRHWGRVRLAHEEGSLEIELSSLGKLKPVRMSAARTPASIFIPSREVLAIFPGFISAYDNRELSFDETYYDLCKALSATPLRGPRMELARQVIRPLEEVLQGKIVLTGDRFYLQTTTGEGTIEAHLLAEGYRKLGSIVYLVANGALTTKGVLFWDEPEANLNPNLIVKVSAILRAMAASGIQVFIATHDYLLTQELGLASEYGTSPVVPTNFFSFTRQRPAGPVTVESAEQLASLKDNAILDEFLRHYDRQQSLFQGQGESLNA